MADTPITDAAIPTAQYVKQSTSPATPPSGKVDHYFAANGSMRAKQDSGTIHVYSLVMPTVQARLSLETGVPISTSDQLAKTTLYLTPFEGNLVTLWDGSNWNPYYLPGDISLSLSGLTANTVRDAWLYDNSGTLTLSSDAWTNDTTPAVSLVDQNGFKLKSGDTGKLLLGAIRIGNTTGQCDDGDLHRYVWNFFNRRPRRLRVIDTTDSLAYSTATFRQWLNNTANRVEFVTRIAQDNLYLKFLANAQVVSGAAAIAGIGLDSTTVSSTALAGYLLNASASNVAGQLIAEYQDVPAIGYHYLQCLEKGNGSGTTTWFGDAGITGVQSGAEGYIWG